MDGKPSKSRRASHPCESNASGIFRRRRRSLLFRYIQDEFRVSFLPHFIQSSLTVSIKQFMIRAAIVLGQARGTHEKSSQVAIDNDLNRVLQVVCPTLFELLH